MTKESVRTARILPGPGRLSAAGFTLIEVLAALVIVSLGLLGVITAVGQTANNAHYMREKTIAHWVAMNRLTEARLQPSAPKIDKTSDEVEMAGRKWRWTMIVTQTPVESMRRIDVSVRPEDAPQDSSLAFVSGFYGAAVAPPGATLILWQGQEQQDRGPGPSPDDDAPKQPPPDDPGDTPPPLPPEPPPEPDFEPGTEK